MLAGSGRAWFVDLETGRARPHAWRGGVLFNSVGVRRDVATRVAFDESRARASDTPWLREVRRLARGADVVVPEPLFFWLCHDSNLSNPAARKRFPGSLELIRDAVGARDWSDTEQRMSELRERLGSARSRQGRRPAAAGTVVVITTYNRPESLARLIDDIERQPPPGRVDVRVYDDASTLDYGAIRARLREHGWSYTRAELNHGRRGWWRWWNAILTDLARAPAERYVVLQDDVRLCDDFFDRALSLWDGIADPAKVSLYLHLDERRAELGSTCWTTTRARQAGAVVLCGWVDCAAFVCGRRMWDALGWRLEPIPRRWYDQPERGSGVPWQISRRLHRQRLGMYRVGASLTVHDDSASQMNAPARLRVPMRTVRYVDGEEAARARALTRSPVVASLASIPERLAGLEAVVEALAPQVDRLNVYLNGHERTPDFLRDARIEVAGGPGHGDRGDAAKFFWADRVHGYHLVCDDDIRYPPDYAEAILAGLRRQPRPGVAGYHGSLLNERIVDYHRSRRLWHFTSALPADTPVHVLGTGVAAYHSSSIAVAPGDFAAPDMADLWLALLGQRQGVPFVCLAREAGWLRGLAGLGGGSIYARALAGDGRSEATRLARAHSPWVLHGAPRRAARPRSGPAAPGVGALTRVPVSGPSRRATLLLPERDHITMAIQASRTYYEADLLRAVREHRPRGTFVDVGAHYGNHSVFFALECGAERVVAIEPNASSYGGLVDNLRLNGIADRVRAMHAAVHPTLRTVRVVALPWSPRGGNAARTNSGMVAVAADGRGPRVAAAPLTELLAGCDRVAVVKVDAEGESASILRSGLDVLARDRPLVAAEAATDAQLRALQAVLEPLGYRALGRYGWTPTWLLTAA
jgi:FkbM family methyltransferase